MAKLFLYLGIIHLDAECIRHRCQAHYQINTGK